MRQISQQIYEVRSWLLLVPFTLAALILLPSFYLAWQTRWHELSSGETRFWLLALAGAWVAGGLFLARGLSLIHATIAVDAEGIWLFERGRETMLAWERIADIRGERRYSHVVLADDRGRRLKVTYALENIEDLTELVKEQVRLPLAGLPRRFRLQSLLLRIGLVAVYALLGWIWLPPYEVRIGAVVGSVFIIAFLIGDMLRRDLSLTARAGELEIRHLRGRETISRDQLLGISLQHHFGGPFDRYCPSLRLHLAEGPRKLYAAQPLTLALFLEAWRTPPQQRPSTFP